MTATTTAAGYAVSTAAATHAATALDDDDDQIKRSMHTNNYTTPKINSNQTFELANDSNWPNDAGETIEMLELTRTKPNNVNGRETNGHHINQ